MTKSTIDPPFFQLVQYPCSACLTSWLLRIRWMLARPLEIKILPKWVQLPFVSYLTMGDLLLAFPLLLIFLYSYNATFVAPKIKFSGTLASYAMFGVLLTANKSNNLLTLILGIPFERLIGYHMLAALTCLVLSGFHIHVAFVYSANTSLSNGDSFGSFAFRDQHNVAGTLLFGTLALLVLSSVFGKIRRLWFEIWLYAHLFLVLCVFIFSVLHGVNKIFFFIAWWFLDVLIRYIVMAGCKYRTRATVQAIGSDVVQLTFDKQFEYNPGQFVQICIPQLSKVQFHPISISSAPHEEQMTLHVRGLGGWTLQLIELAKQQSEVTVMIEGPFGSLSVEIDNQVRYTMALLVSGGIGVTHCQSVGKHLVNQLKQGRNLHRLKFVWAVRDMNLVDGIPPLGGVNGNSKTQTEPPRSIVNTDPKGEILVEEDEKFYRSDQVIQTDIYHTEGVAGDLVDSGERPYNLCYGRPDLDVIFKQIEGEAVLNGVSNVAVIGCGPASFMLALRAACRQHSQSVMDCGGVNFDLHLETFEL